MGDPIPPTGPELTAGVPLAEIPDGGVLRGQVQGEPVVLVRRGDECFAIAAACTHYGAPLADGLVTGCEIRCPYHHARFDLRTGEDVAPPALRPIDCWNVVREGDRVRVAGKRPPPPRSVAPPAVVPTAVAMVGAGAAADSAADMLRRCGFQGAITLVGKDAEPLPVDRPNLSKDFLAGGPEEWLPLRTPEFYAERRITLKSGVEVTRIDTAGHRVHLSAGGAL
jgi:nitrite reductase/ring-hydroxylating ferredoxin subunit